MMLFKLAFRNIKSQIGNYLIYFITVALTISLIFSVNNIIFSDIFAEINEQISSFIQPILIGVSSSLSIVVAFVLGYATSFLLGMRKKEFGLYLTMGMTRGDILLIFIGETLISFLIALICGFGIGLLLFQGLMSMVLAFLEQSIVWSSYSFDGIIVTIIMVVAIFIISSLSSLIYLSKVDISTLLKADKITEKDEKYPYLWFVISLASIFGIVFSIYKIVSLLLRGDFFLYGNEFLIFSILLIASIIILPFSFSKGLLPLLNKLRVLSFRDVNTFNFRQLTGKLNSNGIMLGVLSFLLSISVIGTNWAFQLKLSDEVAINEQYPYEISGSNDVLYGNDIPIDKGIEVIKKYVEFDILVKYDVSTTDRKDISGVLAYSNKDYFISETAYKGLCNILGITPINLDNTFVLCWNYKTAKEREWVEELTETSTIINNQEYTYAGEQIIPTFINVSPTDFVIVVEDEAMKHLNIEYNNLAASLKKSKYDVLSLYEELSYIDKNGYVIRPHYQFREYARIEALNTSSVYLIVALFVSIVFVLLSMAMLALKILSMIQEDKNKYLSLYRIGVSEDLLKSSLFSQIFFFYFLPFVIPILLNIPLAHYFVNMNINNNILVPVESITWQMVLVGTTILVLYSMYFIVTYFISWIEVNNHIKKIK